MPAGLRVHVRDIDGGARTWQGPPPLKASRPQLTPAEVKEALQYLGNLNWKVRDGPGSHAREAPQHLASSGRAATSRCRGSRCRRGETGGTAVFPVTIVAIADFLRTHRLSRSGVPRAGSVASTRPSLLRLRRRLRHAVGHGPRGYAPGVHQVRVVAHGARHRPLARPRSIVEGDAPKASPPAVDAEPRHRDDRAGSGVGRRPRTRARSPAYEIQASTDGGVDDDRRPARRSAGSDGTQTSRSTTLPGPGRRRRRATGAPGRTARATRPGSSRTARTR